MIPTRSLFEAHLQVEDLDRAIVFYRDVLRFSLAHVVQERRAAFFWIGERGRSMLGVWEASSAPQKLTLHTAFETSLDDIIRAPEVLRSAGITPLDFDGNETSEPVVLPWMPAASLYFRDPDGNLLEFISMLPDSPGPEFGILPMSKYLPTR
jgi:lactoylglutathione lyase